MSCRFATEFEGLARRWSAQQRASTAWPNRSDERDLAHWERMAPSYDESHSLARQCPELVERVLQLVPAVASVLDLGAGTGEFSMPLAKRGSRVTAIDHSPAMIARLRAKVATAADGKIDSLVANWEDAEVAPHDVVLAVNALYRTDDLATALERLERLALQSVLVVSYDGQKPEVRSLLHERLGLQPFRRGASGELLREAVFAWGRQPECLEFKFSRVMTYADASTCARELCPGLTPAQVERAPEALADLVDARDGCCRLTIKQRALLMHWRPGFGAN